VEVAKAYYSVPPEYLGLTVWARWDTRLVRVFNQALRTDRDARAATSKAVSARRRNTSRRKKISGLGTGSLEAAGGRESDRSAHGEVVRSDAHSARQRGTRVLLGLRAQAKKHSCEVIEKACEIALSHGEFRLRIVRKLLARQPRSNSHCRGWKSTR